MQSHEDAPDTGTETLRELRPGLPGRTRIADGVVARIAGIGARQVAGVHSVGAGPARALGAFRGAAGTTDSTAGIRVDVGATQVAVDVSLVASYGVPLHSVASNVRKAIYQAVEDLVGLQVIEVNVDVTDVFIGAEGRLPA